VQEFDVSAARHVPPVNVFSAIHHVWATDPSKSAHRTLKARQDFRNAMWIRLIDARLRLPRLATGLADCVRPSLAIEEPRGPRELISVHS